MKKLFIIALFLLASGMMYCSKGPNPNCTYFSRPVTSSIYSGPYSPGQTMHVARCMEGANPYPGRIMKNPYCNTYSEKITDTLGSKTYTQVIYATVCKTGQNPFVAKK